MNISMNYMAIKKSLCDYLDLTAIIKIIPIAKSTIPIHAKFTPGTIFRVSGTDPPLRPWKIT